MQCNAVWQYVPTKPCTLEHIQIRIYWNSCLWEHPKGMGVTHSIKGTNDNCNLSPAEQD